MEAPNKTIAEPAWGRRVQKRPRKAVDLAFEPLKKYEKIKPSIFLEKHEGCFASFSGLVHLKSYGGQNPTV
jgi:hypothetical protein